MTDLRFEKVYFSILQNMQLVAICKFSRYLEDRQRRTMAGQDDGRGPLASVWVSRPPAVAIDQGPAVRRLAG